MGHETRTLECRLIRSLVTPIAMDGVDEVWGKMLEDPHTIGNNSLQMLSKILSGPLGFHARPECVNLFLAGMLVSHSLALSLEFAEETRKFLDADDASGRQRLINFKEAKAKLKGFV